MQLIAAVVPEAAHPGIQRHLQQGVGVRGLRSRVILQISLTRAFTDVPAASTRLRALRSSSSSMTTVRFALSQGATDLG